MSHEKSEITPRPDGLMLPAKPKASLQKELQIRTSLLEQGLEQEIADAIIGYKPEDIPFVYSSATVNVLHHRVRDNWSEGYELIPGQSAVWIGTSDAIHNLVNENGWNDQIPEVIMQWRGSSVVESQQQKARVSITRTEVKQLSNGRFVEVEYAGVSGMGAFDGDISRISLHVPEETFRPYGGSERRSYRIYAFKRNRLPKMDGVPGGTLIRKDAKLHEWSLDTGTRSNVSGTTILNGFQEMLTFHIGGIEPIKEDWRNAFRFTPLPEPVTHKRLPTSPEEGLQMVLAQETAIETAKIVEIEPLARELIVELAPLVLNNLSQGKDISSAVKMQVDGILNHPEKIWILGQSFAHFSREQRFYLAQQFARLAGQGGFVDWIQSLNDSENSRVIDTVVNRTTQQLLSWFKKTAPANLNLEEWIARAQQGVEATKQGFDARQTTIIKRVPGLPASLAGKNPLHSPEYQQVFNGMLVSFLERYVDYLAQQYLGNTLP